MLAEPELLALRESINSDYSTALQDEVQQALNALLDSDPHENNTFLFNPSNYHLYPEYLKRSIDLLEKDHYSIPALMAKKHFFQAYDIHQASI